MTELSKVCQRLTGTIHPLRDPAAGTNCDGECKKGPNVENTNRHDRQRKLMNAVVTRRHTTLSTTLGDLLAVAEDLDGQDALIGLYFPAHWHPPADGTIGHHVPPTGDRLFTTLAGELAAYLSGSLTTFTTPVRTHGDTFSEQVWDRLTRIPYGATTTYGVIAAEFGNRNLAQRVGQSVGHNPVSILVPCHRVVGSDGSLTGYAGGLDRKRTLLALESPPADDAGRLF